MLGSLGHIMHSTEWASGKDKTAFRTTITLITKLKHDLLTDGASVLHRNLILVYATALLCRCFRILSSGKNLIVSPKWPTSLNY